MSRFCLASLFVTRQTTRVSYRRCSLFFPKRPASIPILLTFKPPCLFPPVACSCLQAGLKTLPAPHPASLHGPPAPASASPARAGAWPKEPVPVWTRAAPADAAHDRGFAGGGRLRPPPPIRVDSDVRGSGGKADGGADEEHVGVEAGQRRGQAPYECSCGMGFGTLQVPRQIGARPAKSSDPPAKSRGQPSLACTVRHCAGRGSRVPGAASVWACGWWRVGGTSAGIDSDLSQPCRQTDCLCAASLWTCGRCTSSRVRARAPYHLQASPSRRPSEWPGRSSG